MKDTRIGCKKLSRDNRNDQLNNLSDVLILVEAAEDDWAYREWIRNGIESRIIFKKQPKPIRAIRRFYIRSGLPFQNIWYSKEWKKSVKEAGLIILHINSLNMDMTAYINRLNPKARVIAWYWNSVSAHIRPTKLKGDCDIWSFDPENCKKYGMKFNHQYYFSSLADTSDKIMQDVYFCGSDSGRGKQITDIYDKLQKIGITSRFQVVYPQYGGLPKELISPPVSYDVIRKNIVGTKAILEIVREGQSGATVRTMEALFFRKKLITTNQSVVQEPFYDSRNIYLIKDGSLDGLKEFMMTDMKEFSQEYIDQYDVIQWVNNFRDL